MIDDYISDIILGRLTDNDRVVDIGGGRYPYFRANYIIDKRKYHERVGAVAFGGREEQDIFFSPETWIDRDFFDLPWPFEDNFFDFSLCMGTLEDIRDPIAICREINRVSKAGYISMPTRAAESSIGVSLHPNSNALYGYFHHRWFVEVADNRLVFIYKHPLLYQNRDWLIKNYGQHTLHFFWQDHFSYEERYLVDHNSALADLQEFHNKHNDWLANHSLNDTSDLYNHWPESWGARPDFSMFVEPGSEPFNTKSTVERKWGLVKRIFGR